MCFEMKKLEVPLQAMHKNSNGKKTTIARNGCIEPS